MSKGIQAISRTILWIAVVVVLIAIVAIAAVSYVTFLAPKAEVRVLKIGVPAPLTGYSVKDGQETLYSAQMAVDEINAAGGIMNGTYKLQIISADIGDFVTEKVTSVFNRFITVDKVDMITAGYSSQSNFEIDIAKDAKMIYFLSGDPDSTRIVMAAGGGVQNYPTIWMHCQSFVTYQTDPPIRFIDWAAKGYINWTHGRTFALILGDNPYSNYTGIGMKTNFIAAGWNETMEETVQTGKVLEWGTVLAKIRANPPDIIIDTDYVPSSMTAFITQFLENPTNSYFFGQYGPSLPEFTDLMGTKSTGVIYDLPGFAAVTKYDKAREVSSAFYGKYGWWPAFYGLNMYDQVYSYKYAVEAAGGPDDHIAVGNAIGKLDYQGANAHVQFDLTTHFIKTGNMPTVFYQIVNLQRKVIGITDGFPLTYLDANVTTPPWFK